MALTVRVLDASDNLVSAGYVYQVTSLQHTHRLDEIGTFEMALPYSDHTLVFQRGLYVIVEENYKEIFRGIIDSRERQNDMLNIRGRDVLAELSFVETGTSHTINGDLLGVAIQNLIALTPAWTANAPTISTIFVYAQFKGKSVLDALLELTKTYGYHLRRVDTREIEIGQFGLDKGYILSNPQRITNALRNYQNLLPIENFSELQTRSEIVNRVIAYGGTYDSTVLTLAIGGSLSGYTITGRTRNGTTEYYIDNSSSIALYGVREKVVVFSEITPGDSPSAAALAASKDALLSRAVNYAERFANPQIAYRVDLTGDQADDLLPGDRIQLRYEDDFTSVNDTFFITDKTTSRSAASKDTSLTLSNLERAVLDDFDMQLAGLQRLQEVRFKDL